MTPANGSKTSICCFTGIQLLFTISKRVHICSNLLVAVAANQQAAAKKASEMLPEALEFSFRTLLF